MAGLFTKVQKMSNNFPISSRLCAVKDGNLPEKEVLSMRRVYVRLDPAQVNALVRIAEAERRHPADQAALYIERALSERPTQQTKEVQVQ
jgi:hypothetical protein